MPDWLTHPVALLTIGGGLGTNARYFLGRAVARFQGDAAFPWATFLINVLGSALLGVVAAACLNHPDPARRNWYLLLGTGFCGGFTTFSTFSLETLTLLETGRPWTALGYALGSVAGGLFAVWAAMRIVR